MMQYKADCENVTVCQRCHQDGVMVQKELVCLYLCPTANCAPDRKHASKVVGWTRREPAAATGAAGGPAPPQAG